MIEKVLPKPRLKLHMKKILSSVNPSCDWSIDGTLPRAPAIIEVLFGNANQILNGVVN